MDIFSQKINFSIIFVSVIYIMHGDDLAITWQLLVNCVQP